MLAPASLVHSAPGLIMKAVTARISTILYYGSQHAARAESPRHASVVRLPVPAYCASAFTSSLSVTRCTYAVCIATPGPRPAGAPAVLPRFLLRSCLVCRTVLRLRHFSCWQQSLTG